MTVEAQLRAANSLQVSQITKLKRDVVIQKSRADAAEKTILALRSELERTQSDNTTSAEETNDLIKKIVELKAELKEAAYKKKKD